MEQPLMDERNELIDELVSKAGSTTGQIKLNQDLVKVARLKALGWCPPEKESNDAQLMSPIGYIQERLQKLEDTQKQIQETLIEYKKRIDICSIQR